MDHRCDNHEGVLLHRGHDGERPRPVPPSQRRSDTPERDQPPSRTRIAAEDRDGLCLPPLDLEEAVGCVAIRRVAGKAVHGVRGKRHYPSLLDYLRGGLDIVGREEPGLQSGRRVLSTSFRLSATHFSNSRPLDTGQRVLVRLRGIGPCHASCWHRLRGLGSSSRSPSRLHLPALSPRPLGLGRERANLTRPLSAPECSGQSGRQPCSGCESSSHAPRTNKSENNLLRAYNHHAVGHPRASCPDDAPEPDNETHNKFVKTGQQRWLCQWKMTSPNKGPTKTSRTTVGRRILTTTTSRRPG